jgi:hypothetical protein
MMGLGMELGDHFAVFSGETPDPEALGISGSATKADAVRGMGFLKALHVLDSPITCVRVSPFDETRNLAL